MKLAVTGSHGLIGEALLSEAGGRGDRIVRLARDRTPGQARWDPQRGVDDPDALEGCDAVVHLAGENIASGRWTAARKQRIYDSRVAGTRRLCETLACLRAPPAVLVCASGVNYYGDQPGRTLTEEAPSGEGFLASVCRAWEEAAAPARAAGIRTVHGRLGPVVSRHGGLLRKILPVFRFGLGGVLGDGSQVMSWVALEDAVRAIRHILKTDTLNGPVLVSAPEPVSNREFTRSLARLLHRPALLPVPAALLRLVLGREMADELLLASLRCEPRKLLDTGFRFHYPTLREALAAALSPGQAN